MACAASEAAPAADLEVPRTKDFSCQAGCCGSHRNVLDIAAQLLADKSQDQLKTAEYGHLLRHFQSQHSMHGVVVPRQERLGSWALLRDQDLPLICERDDGCRCRPQPCLWCPTCSPGFESPTIHQQPPAVQTREPGFYDSHQVTGEGFTAGRTWRTWCLTLHLGVAVACEHEQAAVLDFGSCQTDKLSCADPIAVRCSD